MSSAIPYDVIYVKRFFWPFLNTSGSNFYTFSIFVIFNCGAVSNMYAKYLNVTILLIFAVSITLMTVAFASAPPRG